MRKLVLTTFFFLVSLVCSTLFVGAISVSAQACEASDLNTCSWAWNDNIGWVAHNSLDDPTTPAFGVDIAETGGTVTGHAWNDLLGYIDFTGASYDDVSGELSGTATILNLGAGGTVELRGDCIPSCGGYGVTVVGDQVTGFAWNDTIGWIDFQPSLGGVEYTSSQQPNVSGWAWNDSYGWISFRFTEYELDWGVNLEQNASFSGYAWSDNVGWIDYAPAGPYPSAPSHSALWNSTTNEVLGWIQIISMGDDGWIKLTDTGAIPHATTLDLNTGQWAGYGWNDTLGWFAFDHAYGSVLTNPNAAGAATPILQTPLDCVDTHSLDPNAGLTPSLEWSAFGSLDGSTQINYQVQVDENPTFAAPLIDDVVASDGNSYAVGLGTLTYNTVYYWRVRVENSNNEWSEWGDEGPAGESNCMTTQAHPAPDCSFDMTPAVPNKDEPVLFEDTTVTYGGSTKVFWAWDFDDGTTETGAAAGTTTHTYTQEGDYNVSLTVTDSSGYQCTIQEAVPVSLQLPEFKRILPR